MKTKAPLQGIDAVRDLIFGENIKDYEVRFSNLEIKLNNRLLTLDKKIEKLNKAIKMLENSSKKVTSNKVGKEDLSKVFEKLAKSLSQ